MPPVCLKFHTAFLQNVKLWEYKKNKLCFSRTLVFISSGQSPTTHFQMFLQERFNTTYGENMKISSINLKKNTTI